MGSCYLLLIGGGKSRLSRDVEVETKACDGLDCRRDGTRDYDMHFETMGRRQTPCITFAHVREEREQPETSNKRVACPST
jgi:hypothetical protein